MNNALLDFEHSTRSISLTRVWETLMRVPLILNQLLGVMAGLVPAIHALLAEARRKKDVDAREDGVPAAQRGGVSLRGHDGVKASPSHRNAP